MSLVVMCACGDEILGVITPCPRAAATIFVPPSDWMRRIPVCNEHAAELLVTMPKAVTMPVGDVIG